MNEIHYIEALPNTKSSLERLEQRKIEVLLLMDENIKAFTEHIYSEVDDILNIEKSQELLNEIHEALVDKINLILKK